jgi:His/Glu/Gln/Arg/opine family amino acid ABC transporter permease subunit
MRLLPEQIAPDCLPRLLAGMAVNFEIALIAIAVGLALGLVLALLRLGRGILGLPAATIIGLMRAAPTFVVMFFLLNAIPRDFMLFGVKLDLTGVMAVAVSLVPYSAAYVADNALGALAQWRTGSHLGALLFLPNLARAFFVLVMSSGAGAAIGVTEGIAVILRQAEQLPGLEDKLVLFAFGIALFGIPLQSAFFLIRALQGWLSKVMLRRQEPGK